MWRFWKKLLLSIWTQSQPWQFLDRHCPANVLSGKHRNWCIKRERPWRRYSSFGQPSCPSKVGRSLPFNISLNSCWFLLVWLFPWFTCHGHSRKKMCSSMMGIVNYCMYNHKATDQTTEQGRGRGSDWQRNGSSAASVEDIFGEPMFLINKHFFFFIIDINC